MHDLKQLHSRFLQECPDLSDERWRALIAEVEQLARQASTAAIGGFLEEFSSLSKKAVARGNGPHAGLLDLPRIRDWRLSVHFRDAAIASEETRRPASMEAGGDEQMDIYRELWGD